MNPAAEAIRIIKVEVSMAILIGIANNNVIKDTKNTPPPSPQITLIVPTRKPSRSNNEITLPSKYIIN